MSAEVRVFEITVPDYEWSDRRFFVAPDGAPRAPCEFESDVAEMRTAAIEEALAVARKQDHSVQWSVVLDALSRGLVGRGWVLVEPHGVKVGFGSNVGSGDPELNVPDDLRQKLREWHDEHEGRRQVQMHAFLLKHADELEAEGQVARAEEVRRAVAESRKSRGMRSRQWRNGPSP